MITLHTLSSGSSGNAALITAGRYRYLLDAGISFRRIRAALGILRTSPAALDGIFITHTHSDHIAGLEVLLRNSRCPVYATPLTLRGLCRRIAGADARMQALELCQPCSLPGCTVTAVPTSHDAPGSCGFRFDTEDGSLGILTDTGYITEEALALLPGVDCALLESNHDVDRLRSGPYPYPLRARVLGAEGHLSNEDAARFAVLLAQHGARELILAHLSAENNTPQLALSAMETALSGAGYAIALSIAPRFEVGDAHIVRRTPCSGSV